MAQPGFEYRAFISYSHRDQTWARWLLTALETYRLPSDLVDTPNLAGEKIPQRLGKFFRDRDDASAAANLADEIRRALRQSENMIVVASPASARSRYVNQEVEEFAALNAVREQPGRILTLIVDGEPNVSGDGEPAPTECFPPSLRGGLRAPDGTPFEPLAADARSIGDGRTRALSKLVSGLLDIRYDSLVRRDLARRRRNRYSLAAAAIAALAIATGVGWQIESDRREKVRLADAQERTDRDRRTLLAVNNAERARGLLARGNIDGAVALARSSLATDGSIPFVPQAYNVLYGAHFRGAEPTTLDLADYNNYRDLRFFDVGKGGYLVASNWTTLSIWSPGTGITYVRNDVDFGSLARPAVAVPGEAVFVTSMFSDFRYRIADGAWDEIDYNSLSFEGLDPTVQIAVDADTLIGCNDNTLFEIKLPESGNGNAEIGWRTELESSACSSLAFGPEGSVLVGNWNGEVIEFDIAARAETRRYRTGANDWVSWLDVREKLFAAVSTSKTALFRFGSETPFYSFESGFVPALDQEGKYAVGDLPFSGDVAAPDLMVRNLLDGSEVPIDCACKFEGFDGYGNVLTLEGSRKAVLRDPATGDVFRELYTFDTDVDDLLLLAGDTVLLGLRKLAEDTVVPLKRDSSDRFLPAAATLDALLSLDFISDDTVLAVHSRRGEQGSQYRRHDVTVYRRRDDGSAETVWSREGFGGHDGYGEAAYLGHGVIGLKANDGIAGHEAVYTLVAAADGKELYSTHVNAEARFSQSGRYALLDADDDIVAFDLEGGMAVPLGIADLASPLIRNWELKGDSLVAVDGETIRIWDMKALDAGSRDISAGVVHSLCLPDENTAFAAVDTEEGGLLARWPLAGDMQRTAVKIDLENEAIAEIVADALYTGREFKEEHVTCTATSMTLVGFGDDAVVWDSTAGTLEIVPSAELAKPPAPAAPLSDLELISASMLQTAKVSFDDTSVSLLDSSSGRLLRRFDSEGSRVVSAVLLTTRGWVAAGLENGAIRVWDVTAPTVPVISLTVHGAPVEHLKANPAGTAIVSADRSGLARYWPMYAADEVLKLFPEDRQVAAQAGQ